MSDSQVTHADRLARGGVLQQGAQIARMAGGLVVLTVLARRLSLAEFGTYTILLSLITYVQFVKTSVTNAAVVGIAAAGDEPRAVGRVVCTGCFVYAVLGAASGLVLAAIGLAALPLLNVPADLEASARAGVIGLAAVTALGWPVQIFDDLLRAQQRFAAVSALEIAAMAVYVGGALALAFADVPVSLLVTWNASIPLLTGLVCLFALPRLKLPVVLSRGLVDRSEARRFASVSGLLLVSGVADLATYSLDRAILSALRSPAAVGRYEGPLQTQNMIRYLHGVLSAPMVPAAARFHADRERALLRELFLKGMRYTLAITTPFVVTFVVLAQPLVVAWLGPKYAGVGDATAVFCAWWLIGANTGAMGAILIAAQRFRFVAGISWTIALINVPLALLLTNELGIWGPIIAAITAFAVAFAIQLPVVARIAGADFRSLAREVWAPAYSLAIPLAAVLVALTAAVDIEGVAAVLATLVVAPLAYWALYYALFLRADERALVWRTLMAWRRVPSQAT